MLKEYVRGLDSANNTFKRRDFLRKIAGHTSSVSDIDLRSGQTLAEYLVRRKPNEQEQQVVLQYAKQLAEWNAVR